MTIIPILTDKGKSIFANPFAKSEKGPIISHYVFATTDENLSAFTDALEKADMTVKTFVVDGKLIVKARFQHPVDYEKAFEIFRPLLLKFGIKEYTEVNGDVTTFDANGDITDWISQSLITGDD